ncbi:MAG: 4-(cytidine 5'-diphospho)-2-C-methyl-D-erythritol kinase [Nitrospirae bacterium GWC2_57_9]|nr:MAG: 4-(cytidine 5'-diphospho)-2-C-methyl-D-erythritol kinase [Nitrospirae bacterium GWC2_57_9]
MNEITVMAPAKINLCLSVLGRRSDGYHDVEMVMQMVGLYDEVLISRKGTGVTVYCDAASVPSGEGNIVWKAAAALLKRSRADSGVAISIKKNIPVAAGLGGGSSDAAAALCGLNILLDAGLSREELAGIGAGLGMDVPFFFHGPFALARGRGELLTRLPPPPRFWVLLVNPGFETSTAWVYQNINLRLTKKVDCNNIVGLSVRHIAANVHNDLETVTAAAHPVILKVEEALMDQGALGARMSGSGPTVFGIFETEKGCRAAADSLSGRNWRVFPVEALTASPLEVYHTK